MNFRKEVMIIKALTLRVSDGLYKTLKHFMVDKDVTTQQYLLELVKRDLQCDDEGNKLPDNKK